jgi:hypothetical protein
MEVGQMTDQTPEDWVLIEAAKRCGWDVPLDSLRIRYHHSTPYRALCDMIAKHEQKPVDRKLLCAREAMREQRPDDWPETACLRAIELWIEGYGE